MISLRPYQQEAMSAVADGWRRGVRRPLIGLPTGTGKTVIFSSIAKGARSKDRRVLILAHRDELLQQAGEKLVDVAPELAMSIGYVKGKRDDHRADVVIASVQTLSRQARLDRIENAFDLIIVDEAHHAAADSYQRILEGLGSFAPGGPLTIGVTATPQRADGKDLGETWEEIVYHRDMLSMMREGYLCDLRGIQVRLGGLDMGGVRTTAGDYNEGDLELALEAADAPVHGVRAWHHYCEGRQTICFTPTIALAHSVADEFCTSGVVARALSGKTEEGERRQMLADFAAGKIKVIANAQVLTEGYDNPAVECIMIARPTKSKPLYVQMVGRGTRLSPMTGKKDCIVLDIVGVTDRHDLTTLPRLFGLGEDDDAAGGIVLEEGGEPDDAAELADTGSILELVQAREDQERRSGRIVAKQVELFARQDFAWTRARDGLWALSAGKTMVMLEARGDRWDVVSAPRDGARTVVASGLEQGYAMGAAEDFVRSSGDYNAALVSKAAWWRQKPAGDTQLAAIARFGVPVPVGISAGEASDMLSGLIARSRRRNR